MVTLKTPEAPATSKQLWLLHLLTKQDTRGLNLTMQEASNRIEQLKDNHKPSRLTTTGKPQGDKARADYRVSGTSKAIGNHNPQPEREVIQGTMPQGETDMAKIEAHFKANAYQLGRDKAENETARIDFYDFQCKECLFGKTGICEPSWREAGFMTGGGITEPYQEALGYLYDSEYLKVKAFIIGNRKPKNKYSLIVVGKSTFPEEIIKYPYGYGMDINNWGHYFALQEVVKESASVDDLKTYYGKRKDTILKDTIAEYEKVKAEYEEVKQVYTIADFAKLVTWRCPKCDNFYSVFDSSANQYIPRCYRHDPDIEMVKES